MKSFARASITLCIVLMALIVPTAATAEGGKTIASAPIMPFGQQQFASTANGTNAPYLSFCPDATWYSFWQVQAIAGDLVTIDWEALPDKLVSVAGYDPGTTDFNYGSARCLWRSDQNAAGRNSQSFTATQSALYPIVFASAGLATGPGVPYSFTASVQHAIVFGIKRISKVARNGTISIRVHNPEGALVSDPSLSVVAKMKQGRKWKPVGSAAVLNSVAKIRLRIPASKIGKKISLKFESLGAGYVPQVQVKNGIKIK